MRKFLIPFMTAALVLMLFTTGCSKSVPQVPQSQPAKSSPETQNPFETQQGEEFMPSSMGHFPDNPPVDSNGARLPFAYKGDELKLDYAVQAEGKAKNVGFLVFLDGVPQPYKVDSVDASYEYMHIFNLPQDNTPHKFSFLFTPVTGKKGDMLTLNIVSIYNPSFRPDMENTMSYGMYHNILPMELRLAFEQDADSVDYSAISNKKQLQNVSVKTSPITNAELAALSGGMLGEITLEDLNTRTFMTLLYNSASPMDSLKLGQNESLRLCYKLCGIPGVTYKTTFYANHQPIFQADGSSFSTTLTKGGISVIETDIDASLLNEFNTFYAVSVPVNPQDFPNAIVTIEKSQSILIYK